MSLQHLTARSWRQRPARTALSIASVAIAIATVLGTSLSQSSVRRGIRELSLAVDKHPALEIVSSTGERFAADQAPQLGDLPGVADAVPLTTRSTLARLKGRRFNTVVLGLPVDRPAAWDALMLTQGQAVRGSGEAVLSADLAKSIDAKIGDRVVIISRRGPKSAKIVGLADSGALAAFAPAASLAMAIEEVQANFSLENQIDRVRVLIAPDQDRDAIQQALAARMPDELYVQAPASATETIDTTLRSTELALRLAGALSMAMATFIILNTLRLNFSERRRDFAVIRVLGASSRQLVRLQLSEGVALGAIGSVVGVPLGIALGWGLEQAMATMLGLAPRSLEMPYNSILIALLLGPAVAALAAIAPALQARGISASEAMGDPDLRRSEQFPRWALLLGVCCWLVAVSLVWLVVAEWLPPEAAIPAGLLMLVAFVVIIPAVARPLLRAAVWLFGPWLRTEGQLGAEQLLARSTRTGLTVGVLVVALSSGLGLGTAIINNVDDVRGWYRRSLAGDVFLTDPAAIDQTMAEDSGNEIGKRVAEQPGVERVVEIRLRSAKAGGLPAMCIVRDFVPGVELPWVLPTEVASGLRPALERGEVAVSGVLAQKSGVSAGDELRLEVQGRVFSRRVAAIVNDYMFGGRAVYLDKTAAAELITLGSPNFMIVQAKSGTRSDQLAQQLETTLANEGIIVQSFAEMRAQLDGLIDGVVGALWGLLAVGFIVGGVAVSNTLTLNVLEQTRELGLLRIIGLTPGQTRWLVLCEALLLGLLGAVLGTMGGITTALVIHFCNGPVLGRSIPLELHPWLLAANAGGCLLIALFAAWRPGLSASRLNVLSAIAQE